MYRDMLFIESFSMKFIDMCGCKYIDFILIEIAKNLAHLEKRGVYVVTLSELERAGFNELFIAESKRRLEANSIALVGVEEFGDNDLVAVRPLDFFHMIYHYGKFTGASNVETIDELVEYAQNDLGSRWYVAPPKKKKPTVHGNVYLMRNDRNGYTKIGFSKHPPSFRESTLQSQEPEVSLLCSYKGTMKDEKRLHEEFHEKRLRGEWFDLDDSDLIAIEEYFNQDVSFMLN